MYLFKVSFQLFAAFAQLPGMVTREGNQQHENTRDVK
jgi:hypothetical protein